MRANLGINKIVESIGKFVEGVVALFVGLLLLIVAFNVFARYVLKIGITWAEEFSLFLFAWVVFLGIYLALRKKSHLALTVIIEKLPARFQVVSRNVILSIVMLFVVAVGFGGIMFVTKVVRLGQKTPLLGISAAWAYSSVPVSMFLMFLELIKAFVCREHIIRVNSKV